MTEPISLTTAASAAAEGAAKNLSEPARHLLTRILGPTADEIGAWLAEKTRARLRRERTLERAAEILKAAQIEPQPLPAKVALPLLEAAGLEDADELTERWAALLANAAAPRSDVHPSFVSILRELNPRDVQVLDVLWGTQWGSTAHRMPPWAPAPFVRSEFEAVLAQADVARIATGDLTLTLDVLERANLVRRLDVVWGDGPDGNASVSQDQPYEVTRLGISFIRACQPPPKAEGLNQAAE